LRNPAFDFDTETGSSLLTELRELAGRLMAVERAGHTLQPTALVHEAFVRLRTIHANEKLDRSHLYCLFAQAMRRGLIDHARRRRVRLRSREAKAAALQRGSDKELLAIDTALTDLAASEPRLARLVELRFFGGFSNQEIAGILGVSLRTVAREWVLAKAKLQLLLEEDTAHAGSPDES